MAHVVEDARRLSATIAVVGPGRGGKSSFLRCIGERMRTPTREAHEPKVPLLDWLPLDLGQIAGWQTHVDLYAVALGDSVDATRRMVLADADGIIFVADGQASRVDENISALTQLREQLREQYRNPAEIPVTFVYAKSDLPEELLLPATTLDDVFGAESGRSFACDTLRGNGVLEALQSNLLAVMRRFAPAAT